MFGAVFFAVLAFGAVAAMSASASLWLNSLSESPLVEESGSAHGLLLLEASDGTVVHCEGLFDGSVGPGALDLVTTVLNAAGELISPTKTLSCTVVKAGALCKVNELALVYPVNLPWHTLLVLVAGVTFDEFEGTLENTKKEILQPGYHVECMTAKVSNECTGKDRSKFIKNTASGAEFSFEGELKAKCTNFLAPEGKTKGSGTQLGFTVS